MPKLEIDDYVDIDEDLDYQENNNGRIRYFVNLNKLVEDIITILEDEDPNIDIEITGVARWE